MHYSNPTAGIVSVAHNYGFVADSSRGRLVITTAHCLPSLPLCDAASYAHERTYRTLLGPLGGEPTVAAKCLFGNPIADIAVLGSPDDLDEAFAYKELLSAPVPLSIAAVPNGAAARLFLREDRWLAGTVTTNQAGMLRIDGLSQEIIGVLSGLPIVDDGLAIGIICNGGIGNIEEPLIIGAALIDHLPAWLLRAISDGRFRHDKKNAASRLADDEPADDDEDLVLELDDETKAAIAELKRQLDAGQRQRSESHTAR